MLYTLIISPIELVVDWVFNLFINKVSQFGVIGAVCGVSIAINFLALPLYNVADNLQEKERKIAKKLEGQVKRIKKAFKGDERFMMLSTYYRQNNYHPVYVLRSSLSILIEIPFFIAAYHYLSHNEFLAGAKWWIFDNLGKPDEFFVIHIKSFTLGIHILPILMTLINFISGAIYTKDAVFREKAQLYVVATIFLVLLYNSPSGLVIYWILNNLFSLDKNIVSKTKYASKIVYFSISGIMLLFSAILLTRNLMSINANLWKKILLFIFSIFLFSLPFLKKRFIKVNAVNSFLKFNPEIQNSSLFILIFSGLGLAFLLGLMIPSGIIASSPIEFSFLGKTASPISYVFTNSCLFIGLFVFWPVCIYKMFGTRVKQTISAFVFLFFICALFNVFVFKFDYGMLNIFFNIDIYEIEKFTPFFVLLPIIVFLASVAIYFIFQKKRQLLLAILCSVCFAEFSYGIIHCKKICSEFNEYKKQLAENSFSEDKVIHLSKTKKNVVVFFLDAAIGAFFPYALEQLPELKDNFAGTTFYPNTISFSVHTVKGFPAMAGGYEYTPEKLNERKDEPLRIKHNEASLIMPKLFMDAGYEVTVTDPPDPNYTWKGDLSPFTDIGVNAKELARYYSTKYIKEKNLSMGEIDEICKKELRNFAVLQAIYPPIRSIFYYAFRIPQRDESYFIDEFSILYYLTKISDFDSERDTFTFVGNGTTHEPIFLKSDYETPAQKCEIPDNQTYRSKIDEDLMHYDVFVAAIKQLANFFDFLRENGCFDNTRIIVTADHGRGINMDAPFEDFENINPPNFNPLLLVKDFDSNGELKTDNKFMTNADTLFLAKEGLPISNINPFTKKELVQEKENGGVVWPHAGGEWKLRQVVDKNVFTLDKNRALHVKDNIFDKANYQPYLEYEKESKGN